VAEPVGAWGLGLLFLAVLAWPAVPVLRARYDTAALRVRSPLGPGPVPATVAQTRAWPLVLDWCFEGALPGNRPFWRPWSLPRPTPRFAVAALAPDASGPALAEAVSRHLDGSDQLLACTGRAARLGLRLRVKAQDLVWWRARRRDDPWDSGYLVDEPAAWQALHAFQPRRATWLVALNLSDEAVGARIALLTARQAGFAHPVRLLVVGTPVRPSWGPVALLAG
jgi:hypothetical protein